MFHSRPMVTSELFQQNERPTSSFKNRKHLTLTVMLIITVNCIYTIQYTLNVFMFTSYIILPSPCNISISFSNSRRPRDLVLVCRWGGVVGKHLTLSHRNLQLEQLRSTTDIATLTGANRCGILLTSLMVRAAQGTRPRNL